MTPIQQVDAPWQGVALVCKKCSRKLDGGFGKKGREPLSKVLRQGLKDAGHRRALRVIAVDCLGLCPKQAVSVIGSAAPGTVLVVPKGATATEILTALGAPP